MVPCVRPGHHRGSSRGPSRCGQLHKGVPAPHPVAVGGCDPKASDAASRSAPKRKGGSAPEVSSAAKVPFVPKVCAQEEIPVSRAAPNEVKAFTCDSVSQSALGVGISAETYIPPQPLPAEAGNPPQPLSAAKGQSAPGSSAAGGGPTPHAAQAANWSSPRDGTAAP